MKRYAKARTKRGQAGRYWPRKHRREKLGAALVATGVRQVETATVIGTIVDAGDAQVVVTANGMTGSPKTLAVAVESADTAIVVAGKIRTALRADSAVDGFFGIGGMNAAIRLTKKTPAANDATMNLAIDNDTCTGLTAAPTSHNTINGIAPSP